MSSNGFLIVAIYICETLQQAHMTAALQRLATSGTDSDAAGVLTRAVAACVPLKMGVWRHLL